MQTNRTVCVVTGAGSGLGQATAERLAAMGAQVFLLSRTLAKVEAVAHGIRASGGCAVAMAMDVRSPGSVAAAFDAVGRQAGRIHILVNSAGVYREGPFQDLSDETIDELVDTNLKGVVYVVRAALPWLAANSSIVNVASMSGVRALPRQSLYAATKAAIIHLGTCLAGELAAQRIRVNTISPGPAKTPLIYTVVPSDDVPAVEAALAARMPIGRLVEADEVAAAVEFLVGAAAATGAHFVLDGGTVL